jgi:hypothetical protein
MTEIAIAESQIERELIPVNAGASHTPFSWSAAIAGAVAAAAVSLLVIALGSGIGLSFASPYGAGPSVVSLTIAAAVWLVMAQTMGFASGGYLAARLRSPALDGLPGETTFRDAAQGLVVWAIGVIAMAVLVGGLGFLAVGTTARVAAGVATGAATVTRNDATGTTPAEYFVDLMLRPAPGTPTAGNQRASETVGAASSPAQPFSLDSETRAEVTRVVLHGVSQAGLDENDRAYLAQVVAARTGLPPEEAQRRVAMVEGKARDAVNEAADKTAKAAAYFSFWTFMSLLFGAVAATLAGILGGQLRDAEGRLAQAG